MIDSFLGRKRLVDFEDLYRQLFLGHMLVDADDTLHPSLYLALILVGGIRSLETAERLLNDGYADYISICRPFVREPDLIKRWASGDRRKSTCISDGLCREAAFSGDGIHCVIAKKQEA